MVYNLTVEKTHAYFVSERALLVHNAGCGEKSLEDMREQAEAVAARQSALRARFLERQRAQSRALFPGNQ